MLSRKSLLLWRRTRQEGRVSQGGVGADPRRAVMNMEEASDSVRLGVLSFLSGGASDGGRCGPQSGEIVGILKQLMDETSVDLQTLEKEELDQKSSHRTLAKAKTGGISVLAETIEEKKMRRLRLRRRNPSLSRQRRPRGQTKSWFPS